MHQIPPDGGSYRRLPDGSLITLEPTTAPLPARRRTPQPSERGSTQEPISSGEQAAEVPPATAVAADRRPGPRPRRNHRTKEQ